MLFTSFWGWSPETWATVGWSLDRGRTHRDNLLEKVTDPFIVVIYVTRDPKKSDPELVGKIAGYYLMSHICGDRDEFSHPVHHGRNPEKWQHSLKALRAFSYICDPLLDAKEVEPSLRTGAAQSIASWGKVLDDPGQIKLLRETPWREVPIYRPEMPVEVIEDNGPSGSGFVQAGPSATRPFLVSPQAALMKRRLYVLRLEGDTAAYLGEPAAGRTIFKIGLAVSPGDRRRHFQKAMPLGAFRWRVDRMSPGGVDGGFAFEAAVAGEHAMKRHLADCSKHLGGEFYLATEAQIDEAWKRGHAAATQGMNA